MWVVQVRAHWGEGFNSSSDLDLKTTTINSSTDFHSIHALTSTIKDIVISNCDTNLCTVLEQTRIDPKRVACCHQTFKKFLTVKQDNQTGVSGMSSLYTSFLKGMWTLAEFKRPLLREVQKSGLNQVY